jgi:hypothetical protein
VVQAGVEDVLGRRAVFAAHDPAQGWADASSGPYGRYEPAIVQVRVEVERMGVVQAMARDEQEDDVVGVHRRGDVVRSADYVRGLQAPGPPAVLTTGPPCAGGVDEIPLAAHLSVCGGNVSVLATPRPPEFPMTSDQLDTLFEEVGRAEAREQAAAIMLGLRDDIEVRAAYEEAVERVEAARAAYDSALRQTAAANTSPSSRLRAVSRPPHSS